MESKGTGRLAGALSRFRTLRKAAGQATPVRTSDEFPLVRRSTNLCDITLVERHLPEILGRALARSWIDRAFSTALLADPKGLLANHDIHLPDTVSIEVEMTQTQRHRLVVYEQRPGGDRRRVMYLQLVMMAGK
uniref:hypothetical protein n=1 Tax=Roseovarius sp. BRH_c41 TaxID=1629709 RepID=UPI000A81623B|nr:hypothetical protein [Roseovarius sp. BRH_c41]